MKNQVKNSKTTSYKTNSEGFTRGQQKSHRKGRNNLKKSWQAELDWQMPGAH